MRAPLAAYMSRSTGERVAVGTFEACYIYLNKDLGCGLPLQDTVEMSGIP